MFKKTLISLAVASSLGLTGCFGGGSDSKNANPSPNYTDPAIDGKTWPLFNPATSELPVPNDIQFAQETAGDGTLAGSTDNAVTVGLDALDGSSTVAQFDIRLNGTIDADTVDGRPLLQTESGGYIPNPTQNVFLLGLDFPSGDPLQNNAAFYNALAAEEGISLPEGATLPGETPTFDLGLLLQQAQTLAAKLEAGDTSVVPNLQATVAALGSAATEFRVEVIDLNGGTDNTIRITPLEPLDPKKKYLVVVTNEVRDLDGEPLISDPVYDNIIGGENYISSQFVPLTPALRSWEQLASGYFAGVVNGVRAEAGLPNLTSDNIALSLTFTTGGTADVLEAAAAPTQFFYKSAVTSTRQAGILDALVENLEAWPTLTPTQQYLLLRDAAQEEVDQTGEGVGDAALRAGSAMRAQPIPFETLGVNNPTANREITLFPTRISPVDAGIIPSAIGEPGTVIQAGITLPYYLGVPSESEISASDFSALDQSWQASTALGAALEPDGGVPPSDKVTYRYPFPAKQAEVDVPLLISVPDATECGGGPYDVVIYQHGIFGNRTHSLQIGNELAGECYVTVAMDLPLHGIAPTIVSDGSLDPSLSFGVDKFLNPATGQIEDSPLPVNERHFGIGQVGGSRVAMNYSLDAAEAVGASGQNFLNLGNLPVARDNTRQAVVDLLNLNANLVSLNDLDLDGVGGAGDVDVGGTSSLYFIGHSLGGIVGTTFVSIVNGAGSESQIGNESLIPISAAALVTPGGGIAKLLENSPSISPTVLGGLAIENITQGSSDLEIFLNVAQASVDSADPLNFATSLAASTPVYINEVYGDGLDRSTQDQTVPVAADVVYGNMLGSIEGYTAPLGLAKPAPLAGTEPLIMLLEESANANSGTVEVSRFASGNHTTIITRSPIDRFDALFTEIETFFSNN